MVLLAIFVLIAGAASLAIWSRYHLRAAQDAIERRDFREAAVHLRKYLGVWRNQREARLAAAQTARRLGDFEKASEHLQVCAEQGGVDVELEERLLQVQQGDAQEISAMLPRCTNQSADHETFLILEAVIGGILKGLKSASDMGKPVEPAELSRAEKLVDMWSELRPDRPDQAQGLAWSGQIHMLANEHEPALLALRKAVELNPHDVEAQLQLAELLFNDDPEEAAILLEHLHRRYPDDRDVSYSLAVANRHLGKLDEAARLLDKLLAANPTDVVYLVERGYVALNARQHDDAEHLFRRALSAAPGHPLVNLALGGCLMRAGKVKEAKVYLDINKQITEEQLRRQDELADRPPVAQNE